MGGKGKHRKSEETLTGFFQERQSRAAAYAVAGIGHPVGATFTGVRMLSKKTNKCPHKTDAEGRGMEVQTRPRAQEAGKGGKNTSWEFTT